MDRVSPGASIAARLMFAGGSKAADALGVTLSTVEATLSRARKKNSMRTTLLLVVAYLRLVYGNT